MAANSRSPMESSALQLGTISSSTETDNGQTSKRRRLETAKDRTDVAVLRERDDVIDDVIDQDPDAELPEADSPDTDSPDTDSPDAPGPLGWVQRQVMSGANPRDVLSRLIPTSVYIPPDIDDFTLWKLVVQILSKPSRNKLPDINTIDDVINLLQTCSKIMVITGAGVSVSCGIPDFRSQHGIYARLAVDFPDLPNSQVMFDINFFRKNPLPFFKFAKEIYPGQFQPSLTHRFIALLESRDQLLRTYTQNIDTLEQEAGLTRVVQCHGSFATASCTNCKYQVDCEAIRLDIMNQVVPKCPRCSADSSDAFAVMKPDIVFFGEGLPDAFYDTLKSDKDVVDLLIVIGSSMKVQPVAMIPNMLPAKVPQLLINREPLPHLNFDVELLGNCDDIVEHLLSRLGDGWKHIVDKCKVTDKTQCMEELRTGSQTCDMYADNVDAKDSLVSKKPLVTHAIGETLKKGGVRPDADRCQSDESDICRNGVDSVAENEQSGERSSGIRSPSETNKDENTNVDTHAAITNGQTTDKNNTCGSTPIASFEDLLADAMTRGEPYVYVSPSCYLFRGADLTSISHDETSSDDDSDDSGDEVESENRESCALEDVQGLSED